MNKKTPKVTSIGGIFFFSKDPSATKERYKKNLGLITNDWGSTFEFRNAHNPDEINYLQWSPFKEGDKYFEPSEKPFMINYRVQNIKEMVERLKANGVTILDKIEMWEPVDHVFTEMGGETTK